MTHIPKKKIEEIHRRPVEDMRPQPPAVPESWYEEKKEVPQQNVLRMLKKASAQIPIEERNLPHEETIEVNFRDDQPIIVGEPLREELSRHRFVKKPLRLAIILSAVLVLMAASAGSWWLGHVTVTLHPKVENITLENIAMSFDTSVAKVLPVQRVVPAERLEFANSLSDEYQATGHKVIADKARGHVRIYNSYSSAPQALVAATRFVTDSGIMYRLLSSIKIPGAKIAEGKIIPQYIETDLVADKPGEDANLGANGGEITLKIPGFQGTPKYNTFYAVTSTGFSGGFSGEAEVATKDDIAKAEQDLTKRIYDEIKTEIAQKVPPDFKIADTFRHIQITTVDAPRENTRVDRFKVAVRASGKVLVYRERDVLTLLRNFVFKDGDNKDFIPGSLALTFKVKTIDFDKGRADTIANGNARVQSIIPENDLRSALKGKRENDMVDILKSRDDVSAFRISFFPSWLLSAPSNPDKVRFEIKKVSSQ